MTYESQNRCTYKSSFFEFGGSYDTLPNKQCLNKAKLGSPYCCDHTYILELEKANNEIESLRNSLKNTKEELQEANNNLLLSLNLNQKDEEIQKLKLDRDSIKNSLKKTKKELREKRRTSAYVRTEQMRQTQMEQMRQNNYVTFLVPRDMYGNQFQLPTTLNNMSTEA